MSERGFSRGLIFVLLLTLAVMLVVGVQLALGRAKPESIYGALLTGILCMLVLQLEALLRLRRLERA